MEPPGGGYLNAPSSKFVGHSTQDHPEANREAPKIGVFSDSTSKSQRFDVYVERVVQNVTATAAVFR